MNEPLFSAEVTRAKTVVSAGKRAVSRFKAPFKADLACGSQNECSSDGAGAGSHSEPRPVELQVGRPVPQFLSSPEHGEDSQPKAEQESWPPAVMRPSAAPVKNPHSDSPTEKKRKAVNSKKADKESFVKEKAATRNSGNAVVAAGEENRNQILSGANSTIQLLSSVDELSPDIVAAIREAVEFCLAIQFRSGTSTFKSKSSLTQAVLRIWSDPNHVMKQEKNQMR